MSKPTPTAPAVPSYHPDSDAARAAHADAATRALPAEACRTGAIAPVLYPSEGASLASTRWGTHPVTLHRPGTDALATPTPAAPGAVDRG